MKFRIRQGFRAFADLGQAAIFDATGAKSGIRPRNADKVLNLTPEQASAVLCAGHLGRLEPIDDEARKFYGDNGSPVAVPDAVEHPERYYHERVEPRTEFAFAGVR